MDTTTILPLQALYNKDLSHVTCHMSWIFTLSRISYVRHSRCKKILAISFAWHGLTPPLSAKQALTCMQGQRPLFCFRSALSSTLSRFSLINSYLSHYSFQTTIRRQYLFHYHRLVEPYYLPTIHSYNEDSFLARCHCAIIFIIRSFCFAIRTWLSIANNFDGEAGDDLRVGSCYCRRKRCRFGFWRRDCSLC